MNIVEQYECKRMQIEIINMEKQKQFESMMDLESEMEKQMSEKIRLKKIVSQLVAYIENRQNEENI